MTQARVDVGRPSSKGRGPASKTVSMTENIAIARRFVEGVLGGADPAAFEAIVAPDVVVDTGLKPLGRITSRDEYRRVLADTIGAGFTEGSLSIIEIAALVDGRVLVHFEATARNTGSIAGVAPTHRVFTFAELHLMRFAGGRLVENLVGALNPLMYEMHMASVIGPQVMGESGHARADG